MDSFLFKLRSFDFVTQAGLAIVLGVAIGLMSLFLPPLTTLFVVLGIPICLVVMRYPSLAVLSMIVLLCTLIPDNMIPLIPVGSARIYLTDVILIWMLALIIIRWLIDKDFKIKSTPLDLPLFLFLFWAMIGTALAYFQNQVSLEYTIPEVRSVIYYLLFFAVVNLIDDKRSLKFMMESFFWLATIVAGMMVLQFFLGSSVTIIPGRVETLVTEGKAYSEVTRIMDTRGEGLITVAFITKTAVLFIRKIRFGRLIDMVQYALLGIAVVLTFSRTHWLVTGLAMCVTFFLIPQEDRLKLIKWVLIIVFILPIILLPVLIWPDALPSQLVYAAVERASSLSPSNVVASTSTNTLKWRDFEYVYGLPQVAAHPIFGMGLGAIYRPPVFAVDSITKNMQHFTHNSHLWIAIKTGLVGYFFFLWFGFLFIRRGFHFWKNSTDPYIGGVVLGFTLSYLGAIIAGNVHPIFVTLYWTPLLGIMLGTNEAIYRIKDIQEPSPPPPDGIPESG